MNYLTGKKLTCTFIYWFISISFLNAQTPWEQLPPNANPFSCNPNTTSCNYIRNNIFALSCADPTYFYNSDQPFVNCVAYWSYTHGTAQISKWGSLYGPGINHASMRAGFGPDPITGVIRSYSEGIAVGVKRLTANSTFKISFKKRYFSQNNYKYTPDLDNYYVVLLTCAAYNSIKALDEDYTIPQIPATGSQIIYVESNTSNTSWQTVEQYFNTNGAYDVIWIFPKHNTGPNTEAWLEIAEPELIKVGTCQITTPICSLTVSPKGPIDYYHAGGEIGPIGINLNSSLSSGNQWYKDGVLITGATQQTLKVMESGNYSVKNGSCVSNFVAVNTFPYPDNPNLAFGSQVIPVQTSLYYCFNSTESIRQFDMGASANYTWNTNPHSMTQHYFDIVPSSYNVHSPNALVTIASEFPLGVSQGQNQIQAIADLNGRQKVLDYNIGLSPINGIYPFCRNNNYNFYAYYSVSPSQTVMPGGSGFDFENYDFGPNGIIVSPSIYAGQNNITIPGNSPLSAPIVAQFSDDSYINKHFYYNWGGCLKVNFTVDIVCGRSANNILIYPNPAAGIVNITSEERIRSIEITGLMDRTTQIRKIVNSAVAKIDLSSLKPGIYNCTVITDKGNYPKKLIIKPR